MNSRIITVLLATGLLAAAQAVAQPGETPSERQQHQLTLDDLRTFTDVFNQARRNYVNPVEDRALLDAAIRGMLSELDPHSAYLAPEQFEALDDASRGRYSGIGVSLTTRQQRIEIDSIINGSPADEAGMNPGDIITSVDGKPVRGRNLSDAIADMEGKPGTELNLTVQTPDGEERDLQLTREYIQIPTLGFEWLESSYGYFRMTQFHRESATHLHEALDSIAEEGKPLRGLVIDLRDNPGGVLQPAVDIADGFLDSGRIVTTRGRNESMQMEFRAHEGDWLPGIPLVLLVDRGSASASEVLAGALQDHGRALVVGERTFGKGSVQSVLPLRNGGGIKLTTARYYTPSGRSIQATGIVPDIVMGNGETGDGRRRESDLDRHLAEAGSTREKKAEIEKLAIEFPVDEILEVLEQAELFGETEPDPES